MKHITIKDIARHLSLSVSTVSITDSNYKEVLQKENRLWWIFGLLGVALARW